MIELPVVKASDSATNLKPSEHQSTSSSARRERWVARIAPAARNSSAKSRSETESMEFAVGRSKPSAAAVAALSIGNEVPASAATPSGHSLSRARGVGEAAPVAAEHLDVGQQVVAEGDRLGGLQVGVARHDGRGMGLGLTDQRRLQIAQLSVQGVDRLAHPEPEIGRDLVVARARRVQAPGRLADQLLEPRLDVHVDVLERGLELEVAALDFSRDCV